MIKLEENKIIIDNSCIEYQINDKNIKIVRISSNSEEETKILINKLIVVNYHLLTEDSIIEYNGNEDLAFYGFKRINNIFILEFKNVYIKRFVKVGEAKTGKFNSILDLVDVKTTTIKDFPYNTGLTVIIPNEDPLNNKRIASAYVYNGYGKSAGLMQINEIGLLETNIVLTSTLNVGKISDAVVEEIISRNPNIESVNPVVLECNDGALNKSTDRICDKNTYQKALNQSEVFRQGDYGAGAGMTCHGLKGGLGSASRIIELDGKEYHIGLILNTNFGSSNASDFVFLGKRLGPLIQRKDEIYFDKGSCVGVLVTDIPFETRQLQRVLKRIELGLARTGSYAGNGSGDLFVGFTTMRIENKPVYEGQRFNENYINNIFKVVVDMAEECVLNSMLFAHTVKGYKKERICLGEYVSTYIELLDEEIIIK